MKRDQSNQLYAVAQQYMPGGVNSPVRAFRSVIGQPIFMASGDGAYLTDEDGNQYIDYCCSWGPLILGHRPPEVIQAIEKTLQTGTSFGAPTKLENELAQLVVDHHHHIDMIRFVSSGTEAVMSALRLARGYTNKNKVIKFEGCYHGHVDSMLVKAGSGLVTFGTSSSAGVPEPFAAETIVVPLNDIEAVEAAFQTYKDDIAAVIIEPIPANNGLLIQSKLFLEKLRVLCTAYNALLIFDEVISGFRVHFEGATHIYDVVADIYTFGKIIGGGMPVGAYAASKAIMEQVAPLGPVYQAGTLSGNPVAMAAGIAQLTACLQDNFYEELNEKTQYLVESLNEYIEYKDYSVRLFHIGSIFWINFSKDHHVNSADKINSGGMEYFKQFHNFLLENGVYLGPSGYEVGFISRAHTKAIIDTTIEKMKQGFDFVFKV
ncbi:MAG: glutamate-1-semialdehyde 2,1-aminomutase [Chitinophagales bacterium]